mgnify:CR=1 FL=1
MIAEDFTVFWVERLELLGGVSFPCRGPGVLALGVVHARPGTDGLAFGVPSALRPPLRRSGGIVIWAAALYC